MIKMFFVGDTIYTLSGIRKSNVVRFLSLPLWAVLVVWRLSLANGVGMVIGVVGPVLGRGRFLVLFMWRCFASEVSRLPSVWAYFLGFNSFGIGLVDLLSQE